MCTGERSFSTQNVGGQRGRFISTFLLIQYILGVFKSYLMIPFSSDQRPKRYKTRGSLHCSTPSPEKNSSSPHFALLFSLDVVSPAFLYTLLHHTTRRPYNSHNEQLARIVDLQFILHNIIKTLRLNPILTHGIQKEVKKDGSPYTEIHYPQRENYYQESKEED